MTLPQYSFRLVFAACTIGLISHADIVLRDKNNSVAVVYQDDADTKVYYRRCLDSLPQDKLWRN